MPKNCLDAILGRFFGVASRSWR